MKKLLSVLLTVSLSLLTLAGCGSENTSDASLAEKQNDEAVASADSDEGAVLRIAAQPYSLFASVYVAHKLGYFEEELDKIGASYEWLEFQSGPLVNEAVAAGEADTGFMADLPAIIAKSSGQDIEVVSGLGYGEKSTAVLVSPDSDIKSIADLKGKKIAYIVGSYNQHLLALLLNQEGLTLDDVETINLTNADHATVLSNGDVDATVTCEPFVSKFTTEGSAKVLADGTGIKKSNMVNYFVKSYAEEHPLVVQAYIRALDRADEYIAENPTEAAELTAEDFGVDAELNEKVMSNMVFTTDLTDEDINEIESVKNFSLEYDIIQNDFDINDFVTTEYLEAVNE